MAGSRTRASRLLLGLRLLSLALGVAGVTAYLLSSRSKNPMRWSVGDIGGASVSVNRGVLYVLHRYTWSPGDPVYWFYWGEFSLERGGTPRIRQIGQDCVGVPIWALSVPFLAYPCLHWLSCLLWPRRVRSTVCCLGCGYDLRGNVSGRCPECGIAFVLSQT
jgi:hypothetical protein